MTMKKNSKKEKDSINKLVLKVLKFQEDRNKE